MKLHMTIETHVKTEPPPSNPETNQFVDTVEVEPFTQVAAAIGFCRDLIATFNEQELERATFPGSNYKPEERRLLSVSIEVELAESSA